MRALYRGGCPLADVTFTWKGAEFVAKATDALNDGLAAAALVMADTAARNFGRDGNPSKPGGVPGHDTSNLRNRIAYAHPDKLGTPLHAAFGTDVKYGRTLEFGGIIRAKGKALKIPINARGPNRSLIKQYQQDPGRRLTMIQRKGKPPVLALIKNAGRASRRNRTGNYAGGSQIIPLFVLKKSVFIAARPWIRKAANEAKPQAIAMFTQVAGAKLKAEGAIL